MDAQSYSTALADLRTVRDQIKKARAALAKLEVDRNKRIIQLASHDTAKAERIAPAAGLGVADVVSLAPALAPDSLAADNDPQPKAHKPSTDKDTAETTPPTPQKAAAAPAMTSASAHSAPASTTGPKQQHKVETPRELPSVPAGSSGDAWFAHTPSLASTRPNFTQQARSTVFLDTTTGVLVHRNQTHHLDLAARTAADILTAVFHTVPEGVERIYITAGDPWHRDADRYPYLRDAVSAWLNAPTPGWRTDTDTDTGRGRGRMAGYFVHRRNASDPTAFTPNRIPCCRNWDSPTCPAPPPPRRTPCRRVSVPFSAGWPPHGPSAQGKGTSTSPAPHREDRRRPRAARPVAEQPAPPPLRSQPAQASSTGRTRPE
ncbi:hypothetical protein ACH5A2_40405 [Streptomyces collinus]|uniref:hypothetical protein n=1 Tax=Streptomyces collinus TaxID=42684 RepID=UPI0037B37917